MCVCVCVGVCDSCGHVITVPRDDGDNEFMNVLANELTAKVGVAQHLTMMS